MIRMLPLAALALGALVVVGCAEEKKSDLPPPGMAGAQPGTATAAPPTGSRGAGVNPGGMAASQPAAHPMGAPSAAPGSMPGAMATGSAASQPAATGTMPQVIKGDPSQVPPPSTGGKMLTGTVTETMNAAGYTYLKVKGGDGNEFWAAVGETQIANGTTVKLEESITMSNFHSKTLDRTFPSIVFAVLK